MVYPLLLPSSSPSPWGTDVFLHNIIGSGKGWSVVRGRVSWSKRAVMSRGDDGCDAVGWVRIGQLSIRIQMPKLERKNY